MKLRVALFFAGLFGALATLFILLSFGTDYWLLASETCEPHRVSILEVGGGIFLFYEGKERFLNMNLWNNFIVTRINSEALSEAYLLRRCLFKNNNYFLPKL